MPLRVSVFRVRKLLCFESFDFVCMDCSVAHASVYARSLVRSRVCISHIMEFVAASRFVGKALISRYDSPNERPTGFAKPAGVTSPNGSPIGSLDITGGTQYASGWGSKGNSAERAKLAPGMIRPDWNPQPQPVAELKPSFWSNLNPKPSDNQNPFEPLTTVFAAKRDSMGSPPQDFGAMRGGWPAGGQYFKQTGSWASDEDAPRPQMPGHPSVMKYGWRHQQFVRPSPTRS